MQTLTVAFTMHSRYAPIFDSWALHVELTRACSYFYTVTNYFNPVIFLRHGDVWYVSSNRNREVTLP